MNHFIISICDFFSETFRYKSSKKHSSKYILVDGCVQFFNLKICRSTDLEMTRYLWKEKNAWTTLFKQL